MDLTKDQFLDFAAVGSAFNSATGVSYKPSQDTSTPAGLDKNGKTFFTNPSYANNSNSESGKTYTDHFQSMFAPFGILSNDHIDKLQSIGGTAADTDLLQNLTNKLNNGATEKEFHKDVFDALGATPAKEGAGLNAVLASHLLYNKWDNLSPAQKSLGLSQVGIQSVPELSGINLAKTEIPGSKSPVDGKGINIGQALQTMNYGVNGYSLAKNWPQIDVISKLYANTQSVPEGAQVAKSLYMLGEGTNGAAVKGMTPTSIEGLAAFPAPDYGVGALSLSKNSTVPYGYRLLPGTGDKSIAIPQGNASTASVKPNSLLSNVQNVEAISEGTHPVVQNWKRDPSEQNADKGVYGGSQMSASLNQLSQSNPYLLGAAHAFSITHGKDNDPSKISQVQSYLHANGLKDKEVLPDGTTGELASKPVDHNNAIEHFAASAGTTLSRLLTGNDSGAAKEVGGHIGSAVLGKVGAGADFTPQNFSHVMNNMKAIYAKAGVGSREEAYALSNKLYSSGKINDTDLSQMHSSIDMVYDNDFKQANNLAAGRFKGVELANKSNADVPSSRNNNTGALPDQKVSPNGQTKEEIVARNKAKYTPTTPQAAPTQPDQSMGAAA